MKPLGPGPRVQPIIKLLVVVWAGAAVFGLWLMVRYERTAGAAGTAAPLVTTASPQAAGASADSESPVRVIMYAHPRCPCTRASLALLHDLADRATAEARIEVAFYRPAAEPDEWTRTRSWDLAAAIPGAVLRVDPDGVEARAAGALTSGHIVVYDRQGAPVHAGGLSASRGNAAVGDGFERAVDATQAAIAGQPLCTVDPAAPAVPSTPIVTPVYGCAIQGASTEGAP